MSLETDRLDLAPYCNPAALAAQCRAGPSPIYRLIGVSQHSGSLGGGHYTAIGRNANDGCWYEFNDTTARKDRPPSGASSSAYVLFYRLID